MGNQSTQEQSLKISIISGDTQSQQLFDYHSQNLQPMESNMQFPSFIVSQNQSQGLTYSLSHLNKNGLFKLTMPNYRQIKLENVCNINKTIWKVIKKGQNYMLQEGDIIKIGKVKLQVKQINININNKRISLSNRSETQQLLSHTFQQEPQCLSAMSKEDQCRICFDGHNTQSNPLLCLCKCMGTVKFVHFLCLKDWFVNSVVKKETPTCWYYTYTDTRCQLCKQPIPKQFKHQGHRYKLLSFEKCAPPYLFLESIQPQVTNNKIYAYIIKLAQNMQINIGRNNISHVMMKDISVSRKHCTLFIKNKKIFIKDQSSKFGTLVKIKNQIQFNSSDGLQLQCQSKLIQISYNNNLSNQCCCVQIDNFKLTIQNQNQQEYILNDHDSV